MILNSLMQEQKRFQAFNFKLNPHSLIGLGFFIVMRTGIEPVYYDIESVAPYQLG